jgi:hypothetical protein
MVGFVLFAATFLACKKQEDSTPTAAQKLRTRDGFVWHENDSTDWRADSAYWVSSGNRTGLRAYKDGYTYIFYLDWDTAMNIAPGVKTLGPRGAGFTYVHGGTNTSKSPEQLYITDSSGGKISGYFSIATWGGGVKRVTAQFINLPRKY